MKKLLVILLAVAAITMVARADAYDDDDSYRYDVGGGIGMTGYLGDANNANLFKHPGFGANLSFRYMFGLRFALRATFNYASLSGNTADWENKLPNGEEYTFKSNDFDLGARLEYNFFNYGIGSKYKKLKRWTPYLGLGLGINMASCEGNTAVAPSLPMAVGIKYKVKERLNLIAEFSMTKVFGDNVDGKNLSDVNGIASSFAKNTDWVSMLSISITYEFSKRCPTCHYVD